MWSNRRVILALVLGSIFVGGLLLAFPSLRARAEVGRCASFTNASLQVDCVFEIIERTLAARGLGAAFDVFERSYQVVPAIAETGCHRSSHRMGDLAYYQLYVPAQDIDGIDFVQETTACGYGFFHGFFEHLIQDRPDPALVVSVCEKLGARLGEDMGAIRITCYHGSGHGFALAGAERIPPEEWGNIARFTTGPLRLCESLPGVGENEIDECRQGVFNILVDWMVAGQYGFFYDTEKPFVFCDALPERQHHSACYYETAMKLDSVSGFDARVIWQIVQEGQPQFARMAFGVGTAGLMQHVVAQEGGYRTALAQCAELPLEQYTQCVTNLSNGLFEHGKPQQEYRVALELCAEPLVAEQVSVREVCYREVARRLPRFYAREHSLAICEEFPADWRGRCAEEAKKPWEDLFGQP
jgi:hypothetical protein